MLKLFLPSSKRLLATGPERLLKTVAGTSRSVGSCCMALRDLDVMAGRLKVGTGEAELSASKLVTSLVLASSP